MPQPNTEEIAQILNRSLQPLGITAKAAIKQDYLHILLESDGVPEPEEMMPVVSQAIVNQGSEPMPTMVYGRQQGTKQPAWSKELDLSTVARDSYEDEYSEDFQDEEEFQEESFDEPYEETGADENVEEEEISDPLATSAGADKSKLKKLLPLLAVIPVVLLLGGGAWWFFLRSPGSDAPAPVGSSPPAASPTPSPPPTPETPATPAAEPDVSPAEAWRLAINKATNAANLTQTAQTKAEWEAVASEWREAIALLKLVPESSPNYQQAQERLVSYPRNLEYAESAAASRP